MGEYNILMPRDFPPKRAKHGAPTIHFDIDHGVVYFSKGICRLMDIDGGDRVMILQSKSDPATFGFKKTDGEEGFPLRKRGSSRVGLCFVNIALVRLILSTFGSLRNTMVQVGIEPVDGAYWTMKASITHKD